MNDTCPHEAPRFSVNEMFAGLIIPGWLREIVKPQMESGLAMSMFIAMGNLLRFTDVAPTDTYQPFADAMLRITKYQDDLSPEVIAQAVAQAIASVDTVTTWLMEMDTQTLMNHPEATEKVNRFIEHRDNLQSMAFLFQYVERPTTKRQMYLYERALERLDSAALSHKAMWEQTPVELTPRYLNAQRMNEPYWWLFIKE